MPVTYRSHGPHFQWEFEDLYPEHAVFFFDPRIDNSIARAGQRYREQDEVLQVTDLLILRGRDRAFLESVEHDPVLPGLTAGTPVRVLIGGDGESDPEPQLLAPTWAARELPITPTPEVLRGIEYRAIMESSQAVMRLDGYHFVLPSGHHAAEFVRFGEALYDVIDVDRLADWLLPYLGPDAIVVADTGSLLALLLAARHKASAHYGWDVRIECLAEYPAELGPLLVKLEQVRGMAADGGSVVFVISVNSSGHLVDLFERFSDVEHQTVALCDTSTTTPDHVHVFARHPVTRWDMKADGRCDGGCDRYFPARVDPHTYEVRMDIKDPEYRRIAPSGPNDLWRIADDNDAVQLHLTPESPTAVGARTRHYGIYIDVKRLLADERFRNRCLRELRRLGWADELVLPRHGATEALVALAREAWGTAVAERAIFAERGEIHPEHGARLAHARRILILDDALVTGTTLVGIRRSIYNLTKSYDRNPQVESLVLVSRPPHQGAVQRARRNYGNVVDPDPRPAQDPWAPLRSVPLLRQLLPRRPRPSTTTISADYHSVYELFLPQDCPWCDERELLRRLRPRLTEACATTAKRRFDQLERAVLRSPVMIVEGDDATKTPGSGFGELQNRVGFAAAAHEAQKVRLAFEERWRRNGEIVVANTRQIIEAYYDTVLLGGLLRTFSSRELRYGQDPSIDEAMASCGTVMGLENLVEIGWAAVAGRLPSRGVREALRGYRAPSEEVAMIAEMLDVIAGVPVRERADPAD